MRILHVNKFLYRRGGAEAYMLDLAALQEAAGHEIGFFAMAHPENLADANDDRFPSYLELDPPPAGVLGRAKAAGRMIWSREAEAGMADIVDRFRPDVVHLNNIYHQLSPSILRPLAARGIPAVMTLHDYKLACPTYQFLAGDEICEACIDGSLLEPIKRRCNKGSLAGSVLAAVEVGLHRRFRAYAPIGALICPSRFLHDKMRDAGIFPDRLRVLRHFAEIDTIAPATEPGRDLIVAGRLAREKGIDILIDAMAHVDDHLRLTVAGDGPVRGELEAQAQRVAPGRVEFTGRLDKTELHERIRRSVALVMPSRWYENQPMIIMEAHGCATPVVGTALGGIPELIRPGIDGALVGPDDPKALAAAINEIAADPARARAMGAAGRERAVAESSPARHLSGLDDIYAEVISATRANQGVLA